MIRYGIIGAGRMGNTHAAVIEKLPDAATTAVYDPDPSAAEGFRERFGAVVYPDAASLAAAPEVDCVVVCSPTDRHREGIDAAMAAGKAIFCEKALCRDPAEADGLLSRLAAYTPIFTVGFVRRHTPKAQLLRRLLADGRIGRVRYFNVDLSLGCYRRMPGDWFADFSRSGGVIVDMLAHHVDLANWFFGRAERVYADGLLLAPDQPLPADYAAAVVRYPGGVVGNLMCSWQRFGRSEERMEIYGDRGALVLDKEAAVEFIPADGAAPLRLDPAEGPEPVAAGDPFHHEFVNLTAALSGRDVALPTIHDAHASLRVAFAMIESARTGRAVNP